ISAAATPDRQPKTSASAHASPATKATHQPTSRTRHVRPAPRVVARLSSSVPIDADHERVIGRVRYLAIRAVAHAELKFQREVERLDDLDTACGQESGS